MKLNKILAAFAVAALLVHVKIVPIRGLYMSEKSMQEQEDIIEKNADEGWLLTNVVAPPSGGLLLYFQQYTTYEDEKSSKIDKYFK